MKPTRRTQPYRKGKAATRPAGPTMNAMTGGKPLLMANPMDRKRRAAKRRKRRRRRLLFGSVRSKPQY